METRELLKGEVTAFGSAAEKQVRQKVYMDSEGVYCDCRWYRSGRRAQDTVRQLIALLVFCLFMPLTAVAQWIDNLDVAPFYMQPRIRCRKFRLGSVTFGR